MGVDKLILYARNARTHSDAQVAQIAASIKEFGFVNPIVAGTDCVIIAGHGRLLAARKLRMNEVPVIVLDGPHREPAPGARSRGQQTGSERRLG